MAIHERSWTAVRGLHGRRAAPPTRRRSGRGTPGARVRGCDRDERDTRTAAGSGLGLRQSEGWLEDDPPAGRRVEARLPAVGCRADEVRAGRLRALLPPADGRTRDRAQRAPRRRVLPGAPAMEIEPADAQG